MTNQQHCYQLCVCFSVNTFGPFGKNKESKSCNNLNNTNKVYSLLVAEKSSWGVAKNILKGIVRSHIIDIQSADKVCVPLE